VTPRCSVWRVALPLRFSSSSPETPTYAFSKHLADLTRHARKMEEEDRGLIFGNVRYTIIPSDELDSEKTRLVRKRCLSIIHIRMLTIL
jgi:hypothetical protein